MKRLYVGSMNSFSGKTLFTVGFVLNIKDMGYTPGYIKPIGKDPVEYEGEMVDSDALFFRELLGLQSPPKMLSPVVSSLDLLNRTLSGRIRGIDKRILKAIDSLRQQNPLIIAGTTDLFEGSMFGINGIRICRQCQAKALLVEAWQGEETLDDIFGAREILKEHLLGVVINKVRAETLDFVKERIVPYLKRQKIEVYGVVPLDSLLSSVSVNQLVEALGGKVLCAEESLDELVENFSIGAMDVNNAIRYFKASPNKAVITGAHRADIQLAALETSTKCIILTGGLLPNDVVIGKAKLKGVPIISVKDDTFTVVDRIESIMGKARIRQKSKLLRAREIIRENVNIKKLLRAL